MAIQFACRSCGRSIEVDDEWAHRLVECPYCHDTVTAPGISELRPPQARKLEAPPPWEPEAVVPGGVAVAAGRFNTVAIAAFVLAAATVALLIWLSITTGPDLEKALGGVKDTAEMQRILGEALEKKEPWAIRYMFGLLGMAGLWLAGVICGLIGVVRPRRRGWAILALLILFGLALLVAFGAAGSL